MRIVFMGTPEFAVPSLQMLIQQGYNVVGVFTQPDRRAGRGKKMMSPPIKEIAQAHQIPVFQYERIKSEDGMMSLRQLTPDLLITAAYGQILSKNILNVAPLGCINVHASLLPQYRGAAPVQWAILKGEKNTGVTTMMTDIGIDTGDILLKKEVAIGDEETGGELTARLAQVGAHVLLNTLQKLEEGSLQPLPQDAMNASHYPMLEKAHGRISWHQKAEEIRNQVRALQPWPGCYSLMQNEVYKIIKIGKNYVPLPEGINAGQVVKADPKEGLWVATKDYVAEILALQAPNARVMTAKEYLRGRKLPAERFDE